MSKQSDVFAQSCGIQVTAEPVGLAPRDMTVALDRAELHYLVTLRRPGSDVSVRFVYAKPATDGAPPTAGDVLWWMAGDAHVMEGAQAERQLWAAAYGLPPQAEGTARLFDQQRAQRDALAALLGDVGYRRLVSIYETEIAGSQ